MKETFLQRAKENLKAAELLFDNGLYNASANRAYYAAFHAAITAIFSSGILPDIDHRTVQTLFAEQFCNRRKILPSKYKSILQDMQKIRNDADYKDGINKKLSKQQLKSANEFLKIILEAI
ncbi:MAG: hypothetical protein HW421_1799 [Ignavibacteria bacterium]|nr:hypothetical protein [Ignavibacteria bacterium]